MGRICSPETSVSYHITPRNNPEDRRIAGVNVLFVYFRKHNEVPHTKVKVALNEAMSNGTVSLRLLTAVSWSLKPFNHREPYTGPNSNYSTANEALVTECFITQSQQSSTRQCQVKEQSLSVITQRRIQHMNVAVGLGNFSNIRTSRETLHNKLAGAMAYTRRCCWQV